MKAGSPKKARAPVAPAYLPLGPAGGPCAPTPLGYGYYPHPNIFPHYHPHHQVAPGTTLHVRHFTRRRIITRLVQVRDKRAFNDVQQDTCVETQVLDGVFPDLCCHFVSLKSLHLLSGD